tara:strand:+ start:9785 stop:12262 length:2478 start_codon:yes stop_codon:yes gene_type:complete
MSNLVGNVFDASVKADASGNVEISGDLTVSGTTTTVSTTNTVISDKLIELANGTSGSPSGDSGLVIERGSSNNVFIGWDESLDTVTVATGSFTGASTGDLSLTDAALKTAAITASGDISTTGEVKTAKVSFTDGDDAITIADGGGITANTSLTLASGATVSSIKDEDAMGSNSATALATQQSIKAYVDSQVGGSGNMDNWILEDDDGTEVIVSNGKEVKFIGSGLTTNFTDTSDGSNLDPFDLTFTVNAAQTGITSVLNNSLVVGYGSSDANINFATDNEINFDIDGTAQIVLKDGVLEPVTDADIDLGSSSKQFKDGFFHGTLEADAITVNGSALASSATTDTTNASNIGSGTLNAARMAAAQTAITSVVNTSLEIGRDEDNRIKFGTDNQIIFEVDGGDNVIFKTSGEIEATSLDISGDADIDGTLEADAITVGGTALNTVIAGVTVTNATTAAVATTVTISDNESTNEENAVIFTAGGDVDGGNIGLESDGDLTYNPSTGTLSATIFKGNVDAVDGDFDGTLEADAITVGGTNLLTGGVVTSLGTITQDTVTFTSANANDPLVQIKNTTNDANGPILVLENDRGSNNGADNDVCGIIEFKGTDDASVQTTFAMVSTIVKDASNNAEGGEFGIEVASHDGGMHFGLKITDGDADGELDVEIGSGINSVVTANGYSKALNGFLVPEQKSVHIETPMLATADHTATGITTLMTASENIAQGDLVYVSGNGTIGKADADAVAKMPAIGLAVAAINQNQPGAILLQGMFRDDSYNFTAGNRLFVHTDGTVTATAPSGNNDVAQAVGVALSDDVIYFSPDMTLVEITA